MLNFANLMAPVVVALCANSPVVAGALTAAAQAARRAWSMPCTGSGTG